MNQQPGVRPAVPDQGSAPETDWDDLEPGLKEAAHEVQRVLRRAAARPVVTLLATAVVVGLLSVMAVRKVTLHRARVILRVQERAFAGELALAFKGDLANHIYEVVLSRARLLEVVERHKLYPSAHTLGDDVAVSELRDALDVKEFRNYFLIGRGDDNQFASVRIAISFTHPDYRVAADVVQDLAALVIEAEHQRRKTAIAAAVQVADQAVTLATTELEQRQTELASKRYLMVESEGADRARLQVEVVNLEQATRAYQALVDQAQIQRERVALSAGAEERRLGVDVEVAQVILPPPPPASRTRFLVVFAVLGLVMTLPLCAIAVGAFDSRVYDLEDVERLGLAGIGHVPRFASCDDGSLDQRIGRSKRRQRT